MGSVETPRLVALLLRLYPRDFRNRWTEEIGDLSTSLRLQLGSELNGSGFWRSRASWFQFWTSTTWDLLTGAIREWMSRFQSFLGETFQPVETRRSLGERMNSLFTDLRLAIRQVSLRPLYALSIILLMAVGIAGNAAAFRVFNGLFLRPLPFESPEQLVDLDETAPQWDLEYLSIAYRDFDTWREQNDTFQAMAVVDRGGGNMVVDDEAKRVTYLLTSHDIREVLRIDPVQGRFYTAEEDHPDGTRTMMLTYDYWVQEFGSDPEAVGLAVSLDGHPTEIIGILPKEARFLDADVDLWLPLRQTRADWHGWGLKGIGRLQPDTTIDQARQDLTAVHKGMIEEFSVNEISSPLVSSLRERYLGDYKVSAGFLVTAVGIVLLIACANIAGLMFVRSLGRGEEMSLRSALGAPRRRLIQQLLVEAVLLATVGAAIGVALGLWGSNALVNLLRDQFPSWVRFDLDVRFLLFTVLATGAAALLFGLLPALRASRSARVGTGTSRVAGGRLQRMSMSWLVTLEVAMALALLVIGGLSMLDVKRLAQVDPGFQTDGLVSYGVALPEKHYSDASARFAFIDEYLARLETIPGVESAAISSGLPLRGHWGTFFVVEGAPPRAEDEANPVVLNRYATPSYFETIGVQLEAGRRFDEFDGREDGARSIIVNERFVETHLSHLEDPIGARVTQGTDMHDQSMWWTVVGVAKNVKHYGLDEPMRPGVYRPLRERALSFFSVVLKVSGETDPVIDAARLVTTAIDPELPVYQIETMRQRLDESLLTRRATSWLIGAFSAVALLLAIAGIYGVISYAVGQRTQEISIRMAVGAQRRQVLREVLGRGMGLVAIGVVLGLGASLAAASKVAGLLVGVDPTDPLVYVTVTGLLLLVAAIANYVPARRAASVDPIRSLRGE